MSKNETKDEITITDHRNGKTFTFKLSNGNVKASDLEKIKDSQGNPLRSYDPAYMNTVNCTSTISYIDGDKGILEYRGIPIETLSAKSNFVETAYLLLYGSLPSKNQLTYFNNKLVNHTYIHTDLEKLLKTLDTMLIQWVC